MLLLTVVQVNMFSCISSFPWFDRDHLPLTIWPVAMWPTHSKSSCTGSTAHRPFKITWEPTQNFTLHLSDQACTWFSEQQRTKRLSSQHLTQAKKQNLGYLVQPSPHTYQPTQRAATRRCGQSGSLSQSSHRAWLPQNNGNGERLLAFSATSVSGFGWVVVSLEFCFYYFKWCSALTKNTVGVFLFQHLVPLLSNTLSSNLLETKDIFVLSRI